MEIRKIDGIGYMTAKWPLDPARATLVFIHGAGGSADFWQAQIEGLAGRVNTLALDLPGHGRSDGGGQDTIEGYARSVIDFIKRLDVPKPIPCGLSMGGAIVLQLLIDSRDILTAALKRMYYVATISRVDSITEKMGVTTWQAETDRGYARFEILDRENIRRLPGHRVMLTDADGNRFEISNIEELDQRSQALIFTEV